MITVYLEELTAKRRARDQRRVSALFTHSSHGLNCRRDVFRDMSLQWMVPTIRVGWIRWYL